MQSGSRLPPPPLLIQCSGLTRMRRVVNGLINKACTTLVPPPAPSRPTQTPSFVRNSRQRCCCTIELEPPCPPPPPPLISTIAPISCGPAVCCSYKPIPWSKRQKRMSANTQDMLLARQQGFNSRWGTCAEQYSNSNCFVRRSTVLVVLRNVVELYDARRPCLSRRLWTIIGVPTVVFVFFVVVFFGWGEGGGVLKELARCIL